eukprot:6194083-Prymnesium_polylepis.1
MRAAPHESSKHRVCAHARTPASFFVPDEEGHGSPPNRSVLTVNMQVVCPRHRSSITPSVRFEWQPAFVVKPDGFAHEPDGWPARVAGRGRARTSTVWLPRMSSARGERARCRPPHTSSFCRAQV